VKKNAANETCRVVAAQQAEERASEAERGHSGRRWCSTHFVASVGFGRAQAKIQRGHEYT